MAITFVVRTCRWAVATTKVHPMKGVMLQTKMLLQATLGKLIMSKILIAALLAAMTPSMAITSDASAKPMGGPILSGHPGGFHGGWGHGWGRGYGHRFGGVVVLGGESCRVWTRFGFVRVP